MTREEFIEKENRCIKELAINIIKGVESTIRKSYVTYYTVTYPYQSIKLALQFLSAEYPFLKFKYRDNEYSYIEWSLRKVKKNEVSQETVKSFKIDILVSNIQEAIEGDNKRYFVPKDTTLDVYRAAIKKIKANNPKLEIKYDNWSIRWKVKK